LKPGCTKLVPVTESVTPPQVNHCRVMTPNAAVLVANSCDIVREELEQELNNLQKSGCIEESNSPYASALVLVCKKRGAYVYLLITEH